MFYENQLSMLPIASLTDRSRGVERSRILKGAHNPKSKSRFRFWLRGGGLSLTLGLRPQQSPPRESLACCP